MGRDVTLSPLPRIMLEPTARAALLEDLGSAGDITTDALVPASLRIEATLVARQPGVVAGLDLAALAFGLSEPGIAFAVERPDGSTLQPGDVIATVRGPARGVLTAERTALNFLGHLSGVASVTAGIVAAVRGHVPASAARARPRRACARSKIDGVRAGADRTTASASTTPSSSRTTTSPSWAASRRPSRGRAPPWGTS